MVRARVFTKILHPKDGRYYRSFRSQGFDAHGDVPPTWKLQENVWDLKSQNLRMSVEKTLLEGFNKISADLMGELATFKNDFKEVQKEVRELATFKNDLKEVQKEVREVRDDVKYYGGAFGCIVGSMALLASISGIVYAWVKESNPKEVVETPSLLPSEVNWPESVKRFWMRNVLLVE